jgi:hypothetical protein
MQTEGSLGDRIYHALATALQAGRPKAMILGSDSPGLPAAHIDGLLQSTADAALGPTEDGGYYAIACRRFAPAMFRGVNWSTSSTLDDTARALRDCGLTVELGRPWFDIDEPSDLHRLQELSNIPRHTADWLRSNGRLFSISGKEVSNEDSAQILDALRKFGIEPAAGSVVCLRDGITFKFSQPETARRVLQSKSVFAEGPLGILHRQDVGELETEYRSYSDSVGYSLHVVLGTNGSAFAHLDRYNPYESPAAFLLHGVFELMPHLALKILNALRPGRAGQKGKIAAAPRSLEAQSSTHVARPGSGPMRS